VQELVDDGAKLFAIAVQPAGEQPSPGESSDELGGDLRVGIHRQLAALLCPLLAPMMVVSIIYGIAPLLQKHFGWFLRPQRR
jgi:hypothetical protein